MLFSLFYTFVCLTGIKDAEEDDFEDDVDVVCPALNLS